MMAIKGYLKDYECDISTASRPVIAFFLTPCDLQSIKNIVAISSSMYLLSVAKDLTFKR
jgi:hypothetical protein